MYYYAKFFISIQILYETKKIETRLYELLNSQEFSNVLLANYIEDLGRKYFNYLS